MPATDVVVIGGGCTGNSTAFWLASRYRQRVTLLEQWTVGSGPTGRSSGIVRMHYSYNPLMAGSLLGPCSSLAAPGRAVFWRRWASTCPSGPRAMLLALLLALCLGAAAGQLLAAAPLGPAGGASSSGQVAIVSPMDGETQIFLMDVHTGRQWRLTAPPGRSTAPAWSPDGQRIAFVPQ